MGSSSRIAVCKGCGETFDWSYTGPGTKYCPSCRDIAKKERRQRQRKSRKERGKGISIKELIASGREAKCEICGYNKNIHALESSEDWKVPKILCGNCHKKYAPNHQTKKQKKQTLVEFVKYGGLFGDTCYLCGLKDPDVIEEHHIVERKRDFYPGYGGIIPLCRSCHNIVSRDPRVKKEFKEFLVSMENPYGAMSPEHFWKLSLTVQIEIMEKFYSHLAERWQIFR